MPQAPIQAVLKIAGNLDISSPSLISDLRSKISCFPADNLQSKQHRTAFETKGTELWNHATRHHRTSAAAGESSNDGDGKTKIALLRVFAFGMLDSAAQSRNGGMKRAETCVRMLKVAFKCIKACLEAGELEFAAKVAQRAAWWIDEGVGVVDEEVGMRLGGQYLLWRLALVSSLSFFLALVVACL
jgi:hypothetical protein